MPRDAYDERPYTEHAYAETHPSRVAAVARLSGWEAAGPSRARVLEVGCGRGGNLLPMAANLPGATFLGVDRSPVQIAHARRVAADAGLRNVTFVDADFEGLDAADGAFDFVVCHGLLSWIPPSGRAALLARIGRWLAPAGVAHVSFNVLPGWYERLAARDWLRFAAASMGVPAEGARESLRWLRDRVSPELADYRRRLDAVARRLDETDPAYVEHEYLAPDHHPLHVRAFLDEAARAGLAYLGDAIPAATALELLPGEARERARPLATADRQQLVDFVLGTPFRRALLVRASAATARAWEAPAELDPRAFRALHLASRLRPTASPGTFEEAGQLVQVPAPAVQRALRALAEAAPAPLPFADLARGCAPEEGEALAAELFDLWLATGSLDPLVDPPALAAAGGLVACPVARWHAAHGGVVTNRLHQEVAMPDAIVRWVLARLDGTRTQGDLVREARSLDGAGATSDLELRQVIDASLERLAACALV